MKQWQFFETSPECYLAYFQEGNKIFINDQVSYSQEGMEVFDEDASEEVTLHPDGTFTVSANELTQFNCCNYLWSIVQLINHLTEKLPLSKDTILSQAPIFKIHNMEYNGQYKNYSFPVDLKFSFVMDSKIYSDNHQQFIKYAFLDKEICEKKWTVASFANFVVHMMKFMYEAEKSGPNKSDHFLNVDSDIQARLEKVTL